MQPKRYRAWKLRVGQSATITTPGGETVTVRVTKPRDIGNRLMVEVYGPPGSDVAIRRRQDATETREQPAAERHCRACGGRRMRGEGRTLVCQDCRASYPA